MGNRLLEPSLDLLRAERQNDMLGRCRQGAERGKAGLSLDRLIARIDRVDLPRKAIEAAHLREREPVRVESCGSPHQGDAGRR
jgi:hypothetical protein